jgi:cytochrome bd ubiquinol oxidase subunit II
MSYEILGITVLWTFLYGYVIVASIDFGAGFFSYYSVATNRKHIMHTIIERYLSPVWEVTNVFLVFFFVGLIGFFPDSAYYFGTALLVPGSIFIILQAFRGGYYAFSTYGFKDRRFYMFIYGATGLLIPASLSTVLTISEGGFIAIREEKVIFLYRELFTSPYSWSVVLLSIVSVLYISAAFLSYYASRAGDQPALKLVRRYALLWSLPTILASLLVFFAISRHNKEHFDRMLDLSWMFLLSLAAFLGGVYLIWRGIRYGLAFVLVMVQFATAWYGYGASHLPYILYPHITLYDHFTSEPMALALVVVFMLGLLVLVPSLYLLLRLFLFNAKYVQGSKP